MRISIIVAMTHNRVIGLNNLMPWHLPADLKNFKKITLGSPIIMGRKTYESIGRPLPGRSNLIISRNVEFHPEGSLVFNNLDTALLTASQIAEEVFVIGGADLYAALLPRAETLYITEIAYPFPGDTFFPEWQPEEWLEESRTEVSFDPDVSFSYCFLKLTRSQKLTQND
ncbi:MAG: dihydrofolate reductase [Methylovulum sp.]|jgi:dihydrofolate reductase|nr:dihydrofolate reductase [Methylovulum sp.]MCF7999690.1 dihydrofolate reductase [Methylovulum sp.]